MQSEGINSDRVEFVDRLSRRDYLRLYDRIDICLDPLPYNGITTTCDALWMDVPVISLPGKTAAGRASASILHNVGLGEWVAVDGEGFAEIAAKLAGDAGQLAALRKDLRGKFQASSIMNAKAFARDMEAAYREMWKQFCGVS
jgi:protein O-GlcNAc transferase